MSRRYADAAVEGKDVEHTTPPPAPADGLTTSVEHHYVHPGTAVMFAVAPWTKHIPLFAESSKGVGPKCTAALGAVYFLNKGLSKNLVALSRYAMFRSRFGIDGTRYQRLAALYNMGMSVKAFSASVSDTFALFGYTKRWYCAGSCIFGAAFSLAFALLPAKEASANTGAGFMFLVCFCIANIDIFSQGHYSRILRKRPDSGPHLVSWIWFFILCSAMVSAGIQGPVSDKGIPQVSLFVSAAAQLATAFFFVFNWYGERTNSVERREDVLAVREAARAHDVQKAAPSPFSEVTSATEPTAARGERDLCPQLPAGEAGGVRPAEAPLSDALAPVVDADGDAEDDENFEASTKVLCGGAVEFNHEVCRRNWRLFVYSAVMVAAVVAQCLVTVFGTARQLGYSSAVVAVVCCAMGFWACSLVTAKAIVFIFCDMVLYVQVPGVVDSFFMATPACLPEGPHFNYVFYNTVAAIIGNVAGLVGVTAFSYLFSKRGYCTTFVVTTTIKVVAAVFDIAIFKRWNLYIGIPDHAFFILGDTIIVNVVYELGWLPVVLLFSRICPRGSESMIYALAAGFGNVGQSMANTIGSLFIELVWPVTTKGKCDFSNAPMLLLVAHILMPLAVIPLSFILLPRVRICDDLDDEGNAIRRDKRISPASTFDSESDVPTGRPVGLGKPLDGVAAGLEEEEQRHLQQGDKAETAKRPGAA